MDQDNNITINNHQCIAQTTMDLHTLTSCMDIIQRQQDCLRDHQEQDCNVQQNIDLGHCMKLKEVEKGFSDQVSILRKSQQELCAGFVEAHREMSEAIKVARQEQKGRLRMETLGARASGNM